MKTQANKATRARGMAVAGSCRLMGWMGTLILLAGASDALAGDAAEARFRGTGKADPIRIANVRRSDGPAVGQSSVTFDLAWTTPGGRRGT